MTSVTDSHSPIRLDCPMDDEATILKSYEAELAAIEDLDRFYYRSKKRSAADCAAYFARQRERELVRARFDAELRAIRANNTTAPQTLSIRIEDKALGQAPHSTQLCKAKHDLRNSLGVVIGRCQLISEIAPPEPKTSGHVSAILIAAKAMTGILRDDECHLEQHQPPKRPPQSDADVGRTVASSGQDPAAAQTSVGASSRSGHPR